MGVEGKEITTIFCMFFGKADDLRKRSRPAGIDQKALIF
jgi:hypothetical protein